MKSSYKIPIIVIPTVLILSFFVISYDTGLGDTPYDIEVQFDAEEYSVNYFVVNGNTDNIEIDIPLDMIDGVFMIYVNDQVVDDERIILDGNKIIVNYDQNIESVKLMGSHDLGGAEPEPEPEIDTIKETDYDSEKFYEEFGTGSPLIYIETSKPVLDYDNCDRYTYWLTEHQKEKIDLYEDYPRYPPWGNQIFPLVDYCTSVGNLEKTVVDEKIQWEFYGINSEIDPNPDSFRSSEPSTKIELSFGQPYQDGLVPVTISEVTIFAEDLDEITVWNFGLIGHSGDDRRVAWDIIPKEDRIGYQIINDDSQDVIDNSDTPQHLVIPADQHIYEMNCGMFDNIEGESAHPTKVQIKPGNYAVIAKNSIIGIYPDSKGEYSFEFASIFPHYVRFAEDSGVEFSSDTKQCSSTWQIDSESGEEHGDGYYTSMNFRFE